jgi:hypothetical protein
LFFLKTYFTIFKTYVVLFFCYRNEAWHYQHFTSKGASARLTFFRGFKWAAAAMVITIAVDQFFGFHKSDHGAEHH